MVELSSIASFRRSMSSVTSRLDFVIRLFLLQDPLHAKANELGLLNFV